MTRTQRAVVEDRVEQHQQQTDRGRHRGRRPSERCGRGSVTPSTVSSESGARTGNCTELHGDGQVLGALFREVIQRSPPAAGEAREGGLGRLDERRRLDDAVKFDCQRLMEVLVGDGVPLGGYLLGSRCSSRPTRRVGPVGATGLADGLAGSVDESAEETSAPRAGTEQRWRITLFSS